MVKVLDKVRWKLHILKKSIVWGPALYLQLVGRYDKKTIQNWQNVYYGGLPASIVLLSNRLCNGNCYDRALLATLGFEDDDFNIVHASIDGIKLRPDYVDAHGRNNNKIADHCFVERILSNGKTLVYDTSEGLVWDKKLYYFLERPKVRKVNDRHETLNFCEYQDIKNANIENDKYAALLTLPHIENIANEEVLYSDDLKKEIKRYKKQIDFERLQKEVHEDMKFKK